MSRVLPVAFALAAAVLAAQVRLPDETAGVPRPHADHRRGPGGCVSVFKGSRLTLGEMADAAVYFGG